MGFEYKLSLDTSKGESIVNVLANLPGAQLVSAPTATIEFRMESVGSTMPDATASATEYGLYFCDHGGHGREYLGYVTAKLVQTFGTITIEHLE